LSCSSWLIMAWEGMKRRTGCLHAEERSHESVERRSLLLLNIALLCISLSQHRTAHGADPKTRRRLIRSRLASSLPRDKPMFELDQESLPIYARAPLGSKGLSAERRAFIESTAAASCMALNGRDGELQRTMVSCVRRRRQSHVMARPASTSHHHRRCFIVVSAASRSPVKHTGCCMSIKTPFSRAELARRDRARCLFRQVESSNMPTLPTFEIVQGTAKTFADLGIARQFPDV
jgi:hypothetical protein